MTKVERSMGMLTKEESRKCVEEIITYYEKERGEELGMIGAEEILDFVIQTAGPHIYNKGVEDARLSVQKGLEEIDFALTVLRK